MKKSKEQKEIQNVQLKVKRSFRKLCAIAKACVERDAVIVKAVIPIKTRLLLCIRTMGKVFSGQNPTQLSFQIVKRESSSVSCT